MTTILTWGWCRAALLCSMKDLDKSPVDKSGVEKKIVLGHMRWRPSRCSSRGRNTKRKRLNAHKYVSGSWVTDVGIRWPNILWLNRQQKTFEDHSENARTTFLSMKNLIGTFKHNLFNKINLVKMIWTLITLQYTQCVVLKHQDC